MLARMPNLVHALLLAVTATTTSCSGGVSEGPSDTLRAYAQAIEDRRIEDAYGYLSADARQTLSLDAFRRAVEENPTEALEVARALARPTSRPRVRATVTMATGEELLLVYEAGEWRVDRTAVDLYSQATPKQTLVGFIRAFERKRYDVILRYMPDAEKEGLEPASVAEPPPVAPPKPPAPGPTVPGGPIVPPPLSPSAAPSATPAPTASAAPEPAPAPAIEEGTGALTAEKLRESWEGPQKEQIGRLVAALKAALPTAAIEEIADTAAMTYGAGETVSFVRERGLWKIKNF